MDARYLHIAAAGLRNGARRLADLVMPPQCPITNEPAPGPQLFSPAGWSALHLIETPYCDRCGAPFSVDYGEGVECPSCIAKPPSFDRARAAFSYNDAAGKLVSGLKFSDRTDLAAILAKAMIRAGGDVLSKSALVAPIPLHWRRLAARRFNQSAVLAKEIAGLSDAPLAQQLFYRRRATPPQRQLPSTDARQRNVAGAFAVSQTNRPLVDGARVLLIDDVLTTGATLSAASRALKKAGAARVDALVLARVVKGRMGAI